MLFFFEGKKSSFFVVLFFRFVCRPHPPPPLFFLFYFSAIAESLDIAVCLMLGRKSFFPLCHPRRLCRCFFFIFFSIIFLLFLVFWAKKKQKPETLFDMWRSSFEWLLKRALRFVVQRALGRVLKSEVRRELSRERRGEGAMQTCPRSDIEKKGLEDDVVVVFQSFCAPLSVLSLCFFVLVHSWPCRTMTLHLETETDNASNEDMNFEAQAITQKNSR